MHTRKKPVWRRRRRFWPSGNYGRPSKESCGFASVDNFVDSFVGLCAIVQYIYQMLCLFMTYHGTLQLNHRAQPFKRAPALYHSSCFLRDLLTSR